MGLLGKIFRSALDPNERALLGLIDKYREATHLSEKEREAKIKEAEEALSFLRSKNNEKQDNA